MDAPARLLKLLSLLQARPQWSGPDLATRLGVTERTLRRDVNRIRDLGYPVEAIPGRHGGYRMTAGGALPPLLLDDDEAIAVALGLRAAATGALPGLEDATLSALAKIEKILPRRLRTSLAAVEEATVSVRPGGGGGPSIDSELLGVVAQACLGPERLRFSYIDARGNATERYVEPLKLVRAARRWYLVARDRDREAWRTFRLDRMASAVSTGMPVIHVDPPDPAELVSEALSVSSYPHVGRVLLHVPFEDASRLVSSTVGRIEPAEEGTILRLGADSFDWIARYLASLPCDFTVLDPDDLRHSLTALARRLEGS